MKLSEAIRLGAASTKAGKPGSFFDDNGGTCALGAALYAVGERDPDYIRGFYSLHIHFHDISEDYTKYLCPQCQGSFLAISAIWHLYDMHRWSRERIADWVELNVEQVPEPETVVETGAVEAK